MMEKNRGFVAVLLLMILLTNSCRVSECLEAPSRRLVFVKKTPPNVERLIFENDSVEYYVLQDLWGELKVRGHWACRGDTLLLKFTMKSPFQEGKIDVKPIENISSDCCKIIFETDDGLPLSGATAFVNEKEYLLDYDGKVEIGSTKMDSIGVDFVRNRFRYKFREKLNSDLIVKITVSQGREVLYEFVPEKLVRKGIGWGDVRALDENPFLPRRD